MCAVFDALSIHIILKFISVDAFYGCEFHLLTIFTFHSYDGLFVLVKRTCLALFMLIKHNTCSLELGTGTQFWFYPSSNYRFWKRKKNQTKKEKQRRSYHLKGVIEICLLLYEHFKTMSIEIMNVFDASRYTQHNRDIQR